LFFLGIESWKWAKRVYFRHRARKVMGGGTTDVESRMFGHYFTMTDNAAATKAQ
jgi:hypothetical protein